MPEVPDRNTSNKTLKGGEVTQDKDQNTPTDKTDGDDNKDTTGYESAKSHFWNNLHQVRSKSKDWKAK
jgi:hypothetical protein